jgi:hypothetical protein
MDTILGVPPRRIKQLEDDVKRGAPMTNLTQQERDVLHRRASDENLEYWNTERTKAVEADDIPRILMCDSIRRLMLLLTVPHASDGALLDDLGSVFEKLERLPQEH